VNLALVQFSPKFGGATISGQMIASGLIERGWSVDAFFAFDGPFVAHAESCGCQSHVIPHKNWLRTRNPIRFGRHFLAERCAAEEFERAFRRLKPDLVYVNSLVSYAAALAGRRLGLPVVWHIRELFDDLHGEMTWPGWPMKRFVRKQIFGLANRIITNSEAVRLNVLGPVREARCEVVYNGVDSRYFGSRGDRDECRKQVGLPPKVPLVGLPGTLRPVKGHEFFFRAIPRVLEVVPDCRFAVSGAIDSEFARQLRSDVEGRDFADRLTFVGRVDDMVPFYHGCDVCCVPSLSESFGRTAIECLATATPVVTTTVGGLKEIIRDGQNGYLVDYNDVSALSDRIVRLLRVDESQRLVQQGVKDAFLNYTQSGYLERVSAILRGALVKAKQSERLDSNRL